MTKGESFEESGNAQVRDGEDAASEAALRAPRRDDARPDDDGAGAEALDADVQNLLYALASEEQERDADWVEASRDEDDAPDPETAPAEGHGADTPELPPAPAPASDAPAPQTVGLEAINALGEKIDASEARHTEAMGKMGHALGVIAKRIDGIETRITDRAITEVAMTAAPPEEDDPTVAPYIARAERELKRGPGGRTDIFDRIAKATESQLDDRPGQGTATRLANANAGRRVGTKRWQPSSTVKRRMQQLEESATDTRAPAETPSSDEAPAPSPHPREEARATAAPSAPRETARPAAAPEPASEPSPDPEPHPRPKAAKASPAPEPVLDLDDEEEDDSGLSVVPGARGRRRNRARKSHLDADFEDIFVEEDAKPSIQSLRRRMRERPVTDALTETGQKAGFLGGILGRKKAGASEAEDDTDEAAFEDALDDAPVTRSRKAARVEVEEDADLDDDFDEDFDDEEPAARRGIGKPVLYALIAAAAAAGFFVFRLIAG